MDKQFVFYIGDYFLNFGIQTWFNKKEPKDMDISPDLQKKIAEIFSKIKWARTYSISSAHLETLINESSLNKTILEEIKKLRKDLSYLEKKELFYKLLIYEMRLILPDITDNNYSFEDEINSAEDFMNLNYMPKIYKERLPE